MWRDKSKIVLLSGSAGGGKSRIAAEKLHAYCLKYPGATALMLRKTRQSMTNSTVLFVDRKIIGDTPGVKLVSSKYRFEYDNGSILAYGGMADKDQREHIRSIGQDAGLDIVWMEEATHFTKEDFQEVAPRMRGKAAGWAQLIMSTNPDGPRHWIYQDFIKTKAASIYYSGAKDNPHNPPEYLEWLEMLTGVHYQRMVEGKWVIAEGAVYPDFDPLYNVTEDAEYDPAKGSVFWGIDDGYAYGAGPGTIGYHPRVVLMGQITAQGGLHIFAETYTTGVSDYQETIGDLVSWGFPRPEVASVDSSAAMFRGALSKAGIINVGATHKVAEGIKNVRRLVKDAKGVRLLQIHPRCENLIQEMQSYLYNSNSSVAHAGEPQPLKLDDHGPDALRYMAWRLRTNQ